MLRRRTPTPFKTITSDNGTELHDYASVEEATGVRSTSLPPTTPGNEAATRTSTACSASTSRRGRAKPGSLSAGAMPWRMT